MKRQILKAIASGLIDFKQAVKFNLFDEITFIQPLIICPDYAVLNNEKLTPDEVVQLGNIRKLMGFLTVDIILNSESELLNLTSIINKMYE